MWHHVLAAAAYGVRTKPQQEAAKSHPLVLPHDLNPPGYISAPLTPSQRTAYRAIIGGKWKWAEALPELQYYYETHGFGITAVNSTLKWAGGFLEAYEHPNSKQAAFNAAADLVSHASCIGDTGCITTSN